MKFKFAVPYNQIIHYKILIRIYPIISKPWLIWMMASNRMVMAWGLRLCTLQEKVQKSAAKGLGEGVKKALMLDLFKL